MAMYNNYNYLIHYGIPGQRWGERNGPPYPLDSSAKSNSEKKNQNRSGFHLTDTQKKALIIGGIAVGAALAAYGAYKFQVIKHLPRDLNGLANPLRRRNNCKDVAEAQVKRMLGVDSNAVAGEKTVTGNLHDFVKQREYNKNGYKFIGGDLGVFPSADPDETIKNVKKQIMKSGAENDVGIISVDWNPNYLRNESDGTGHAFNWVVKNGDVAFFDDQPDEPVLDASKYFKAINIEKNIEVLKITKEAFSK